MVIGIRAFPRPLQCSVKYLIWDKITITLRMYWNYFVISYNELVMDINSMQDIKRTLNELKHKPKITHLVINILISKNNEEMGK